MQSFKAGRLFGAAFLSKGILSMDISRYMIPVEQLINCSEQCFAHLSEDGTQKETLKEHTQRSQKYWLLIAKNKCIDEIMERFEEEYFENLSQDCRNIFEEMTINIVTMHDLGKVNPAFQKKKMGNIWYKDMTPDNNIGSKHSIVSSIFYLDYYLDFIKRMIDEEKITKAESENIKDFAYMYSYIISRHHGGLTEFEKYLDELSGKSDDSDNLGKRTYDWYTESGINAVLSYDRYSENVFKLRRTYKEMNKRLTSDSDRKSVILYAWIRLLYSMLVAADYYATSEYMTGWEQNTFGNINNIDEIMSEYEKGLIPKCIREYEKTSYPIAYELFGGIDRNTDINGMKGINILRTEMFLDSENVLMNNTDKNIFYLEAPTGSGKSNMAMNLSFKLMKNSQDINKIFYIYPFNTLVEQNMNSLANVFGNNESVMSQIAVVNSITPYKDISDDELDKNYQRILLDRQFMNYPTVLSTHVMLFNTNDTRVDTDKTLESSDIREYLNTKDFFKYYENVILPVLLKSQKKITDDNIKHFFKEKVGKLNYPYVCEKMKLIEDGRKLISVYFARSIQAGDNVIDGADVWNEYKELIENPDLSYSERTVRIHDVRSKMNMFIYQFKEDIKSNIEWNEQIGDIYYIEDGEDYFDDNGVLKKEMIVTADELFI